jgi:hypothetical protein
LLQKYEEKITQPNILYPFFRKRLRYLCKKRTGNTRFPALFYLILFKFVITPLAPWRGVGGEALLNHNLTAVDNIQTLGGVGHLTALQVVDY